MLAFLAGVLVLALMLLTYRIPYSGHEQLLESVLTTAGVVIFSGAGIYAVASASPKLVRPAGKGRGVETTALQVALLGNSHSIQVSSLGELRKVADLLCEPLLRPGDRGAIESEDFDVVLHGQLGFFLKRIPEAVPEPINKGSGPPPPSPPEDPDKVRNEVVAELQKALFPPQPAPEKTSTLVRDCALGQMRVP